MNTIPTPSSPTWLRPLGSTGISVSAVIAGGGPIGGQPELFGYDVPERQGIDLVRDILASPIRVIDTSNGYSVGKSEQRIGTALREMGGLPADHLIVTKVDARGDDYSATRIRDSIRESQDRLGLDTFPLVHLHDPEGHPGSGLDSPGGAIEALVSLRDEGVIGHLGVAGGHIPTMHRMLDTGVFEVILTHSRLTLLDRSADDLVDRAVDLGLGVMNAAVLGGGLLGSRSAKPFYGYRPPAQEILDSAAALHDLADEYGIALANAAVQHSLSDQRVTATVVGFSKSARIPQLLEGLETRIPDQFWNQAAHLLPPSKLWLDPPITHHQV
ncbi:aldo/keto reductase [Planctomonas sp. JC2975]|uniref:aldo/keto reductase n=1 Tax=Planctomonas sp. JC2975 TaxID=2729626 RepID=UPI0014736E89|nr:aldo/keto reductase [Planctomonas sp. JC2975]NNC11589.1 aldo/keto reductase [Planctomonas sp. JC2975]